MEERGKREKKGFLELGGEAWRKTREFAVHGAKVD
jgi:hypothetical protein